MKRILIYLPIALACAIVMTACSKSETQTASSQTDANLTNVSYSPNQAGIYDSEDAAVVVAKNTEDKTVQFQNITSSRRYTLNYDGTTTVYDKNDQSMSMEQLKEGSIVTVRFYKATKSLAYVKENTECVSLSGISNYTMDLAKGTITVGNDTYNISAHVVVISDGRETDMMEVNQVDVISLWGYNHMIYGISVDKGHGYLRLENEDYFVGGWVEVGNSVIRKISEDMLIVVPEGTYSVDVSNKGTTATQQITFKRNEEMAWDLGEVEITIVQKGTIIFTLTPLTATVVIDGQQVNTSNPVTLEYGLHRMQISADGYDTVSQYIKVAEASANISVELEKSEEESSETAEKETSTEASASSSTTTTSSKTEAESSDTKESESSTESKSSSEEESSETKSSDGDVVVSASSKYKVYIDAPEGVEAYLDGNYIGITPVSFAKEEGSYVVSLRKSGYQTRSYTLQIDGEEKDINYTFTELVAIDE